MGSQTQVISLLAAQLRVGDSSESQPDRLADFSSTF